MTDLTLVTSSNIEAIGHDGQTLAVKFRNGGLFHYPGVPASEYEAMLRAESIGKHFHANIRGKFPGTKADG
ncbi:MAG: KTSC domain-containing protein [Pseudomonadota bacterium]